MNLIKNEFNQILTDIVAITSATYLQEHFKLIFGYFFIEI